MFLHYPSSFIECSVKHMRLEIVCHFADIEIGRRVCITVMQSYKIPIIAWLQKIRMMSSRAAGCDHTICSTVNILHVHYFLIYVLMRVLNDAKRINPEVPKSECSCHSNSVPESSRKRDQIYAFHMRVEIGSCRCVVRPVAPKVCQRNPLFAHACNWLTEANHITLIAAYVYDSCWHC